MPLLGFWTVDISFASKRNGPFLFVSFKIRTSCSTVTTDPNSAIDDMKTLKDKNNTTIPWNREQRGMMEKP